MFKCGPTPRVMWWGSVLQALQAGFWLIADKPERTKPCHCEPRNVQIIIKIGQIIVRLINKLASPCQTYLYNNIIVMAPQHYLLSEFSSNRSLRRFRLTTFAKKQKTERETETNSITDCKVLKLGLGHGWYQCCGGVLALHRDNGMIMPRTIPFMGKQKSSYMISYCILCVIRYSFIVISDFCCLPFDIYFTPVTIANARFSSCLATGSVSWGCREG